MGKKGEEVVECSEDGLRSKFCKVRKNATHAER